MPWCGRSTSEDQREPPNATPAIVLGLRNFTYLGVVIWLGLMLYQRIDQDNDQSPGPVKSN